MAMAAGTDDGEPMMEINTTPLIDLMLVLIVMFIITIPIQTHAVKIDLPVNNPNPPPVEIKPDVNKLTITAQNVVNWNGSPVDLVTLRSYLEATTQLTPVPELHVQPDPQARYNTVNEVVAIIRRAKVTKLGFIGNDQYQTFGK